MNGLILAQTTSSGAAPVAAPAPGQSEIVSGQVQAPGAGTMAGSQSITGAPGATTQNSAPPPTGIFGPYGMFLLVILGLWIFLLRSGKGKNKAQDKMLAAIKKGDEIQTIGGVLGKVVEVRDDRIQIKVDESANTKVWFARSAIHRVLSGGDVTLK